MPYDLLLNKQVMADLTVSEKAEVYDLLVGLALIAKVELYRHNSRAKPETLVMAVTDSCGRRVRAGVDDLLLAIKDEVKWTAP